MMVNHANKWFIMFDSDLQYGVTTHNQREYANYTVSRVVHNHGVFSMHSYS